MKKREDHRVETKVGTRGCLRDFAVIRVSFDIHGFVEPFPLELTNPALFNGQEVGNETSYDYWMVGQYDWDLENYIVTPGDKIYNSWAQAMVDAIEKQTMYDIHNNII